MKQKVRKVILIKPLLLVWKKKNVDMISAPVFCQKHVGLARAARSKTFFGSGVLSCFVVRGALFRGFVLGGLGPDTTYTVDLFELRCIIQQTRMKFINTISSQSDRRRSQLVETRDVVLRLKTIIVVSVVISVWWLCSWSRRWSRIFDPRLNSASLCLILVWYIPFSF